jgi:2,4-diaminopentanoate dehydrogenase
MSADGVWKITVKGPTGPQITELKLATVEGVLTGIQTGQGQSSEITDTKVEGNSVYWVNHVTKPMKMKVEFSGVIDGDNISGKVKAGFAGSFPFTGVRTS